MSRLRLTSFCCLAKMLSELQDSVKQAVTLREKMIIFCPCGYCEKEKKMMKKLYQVFALSLLSVLLIGSIGGMYSAVSAETESSPVGKISGFEMKSGASVRLSENGNGIRFAMQLPKNEYEELMRSPLYDEVTFGMLIAPADYIAAYGELDEEHVFGDQAVYDYAVWTDTDNDGESDKWIYNGDRVRITNITADAMKPDPDNENYMIHTGSLINLKEENLLREFVGMGYIEYISGEETHYLFAPSADNVRSMAAVAQSALDDSDSGLTTEQHELLQKDYVQKGCKTVIGGTVELNGKTMRSIEGMNMRYDSGKGIGIVSEANAEGGENISDDPVLFTNATGRYAVIEFGYIVRQNSNGGFGLGIDVFSDKSEGSHNNKQTIRLMYQGVRIADTFGNIGAGIWYEGNSETGAAQTNNTTYSNLTTNLFDRDTERRVRFVRNGDETYIYVQRVGMDEDYILLGRFVTKNSDVKGLELAYGISLTAANASTVELFGISITLGQDAVNAVIEK